MPYTKKHFQNQANYYCIKKHCVRCAACMYSTATVAAAAGNIDICNNCLFIYRIKWTDAISQTANKNGYLLRWIMYKTKPCDCHPSYSQVLCSANQTKIFSAGSLCASEQHTKKTERMF